MGQIMTTTRANKMPHELSGWIRLPFQLHFREALLSGVKCYTARKKRMGVPRDRFIAFGRQFELLSIEDVDLYTVSLLWKEEGCTSREHFIEVWQSIHPRIGYSDSQRVYLHHFTLLP